MLAAARRWAEAGEPDVHCRLSQCLNCCDGGHTVRVECRGREVALVGIRTTDELHRVLENIEAIGERDVPASLRPRVWQEWVDGEMVFHHDIKPDESA